MASTINPLLYLNFRNGIEHVPGFRGSREGDLKDIYNLNLR